METSIPVQFSLKSIQEELKPKDVLAMEGEDEIMARLQTYKEWEVLKEKIQRRIEAIEDGAKADIATMDDVTLHGFRCIAKDAIIEQLRAIIEDVEIPAQVLKEQKNETE